MGQKAPVWWPKGWKFPRVLVLVGVLLAGAGEASSKFSYDYSEPFDLPLVVIPEGSGIEHFFGTWAALDGRRLSITGAMTIGSERIEYADLERDYDKFYKVLRITCEYAIFVVHYKNPVRVGLVTRFELLTLRRDPKDGETLLFVGIRDDFRMNDEPLIRPLDFYRRLLDNPDERVSPVTSGPWGKWSFSVYELYKN